MVNGISANIHELLDEKAPSGDPQKADTAIFYSISNCQAGLAGVSFGNFLIKRVVADLVSKLPNLKTFSTLSPIPGFTSWIRKHHEELELSESERETIELLSEEEFDAKEFRLFTDRDKKRGKDEEEMAKQLKKDLSRLCGYYLLNAKRGQQAYDRVAHFHLTNGARVKQINWAADISIKGIEQSAGMMVNYLYDLPSIEKHHEAYSSHGEISASAAVRKLAK